jgi:hypothetical protein
MEIVLGLTQIQCKNVVEETEAGQAETERAPPLSDRGAARRGEVGPELATGWAVARAWASWRRPFGRNCI